MRLKLLMISICITNMFSNKPRRCIKSTIIEHQTSLCKIQVPGSVGKTVGDKVRVIDGASSTVGANFCGRSAASNLFRVTIEHATFVTWHWCSEYFSILEKTRWASIIKCERYTKHFHLQKGLHEGRSRSNCRKMENSSLPHVLPGKCLVR